MDTKEIVKSWKWRIVKAGYTATEFAEEIGIAQSAMSAYLTEKKCPSLNRFSEIETKLTSLGV